MAMVVTVVTGVLLLVAALPATATGPAPSAVRDDNPVLYVEHRLLHFQHGPVPEGRYATPPGRARITAAGQDITLVGISAMQAECQAARHYLAEVGIRAEVIDPIWLSPLDTETIFNSVRKTHRAVLVEENKPFCGVDAQIAAMIQEHCFDDLDAPVLRISAIDAPAIYSPKLEVKQLPRPTDVVAKVLKVCA